MAGRGFCLKSSHPFAALDGSVSSYIPRSAISWLTSSKPFPLPLVAAHNTVPRIGSFVFSHFLPTGWQLCFISQLKVSSRDCNMSQTLLSTSAGSRASDKDSRYSRALVGRYARPASATSRRLVGTATSRVLLLVLLLVLGYSASTSPSSSFCWLKLLFLSLFSCCPPWS